MGGRSALQGKKTDGERASDDHCHGLVTYPRDRWGAIGSILVIYALNLPIFSAALLTPLIVPLIIFFFEENYGNSEVKYLNFPRESGRCFPSIKVVQSLASAEVLRYSVVSINFFVYQPYMVSVGLKEEFLGIYFSILMISSVLGSLLSSRLAVHLDRGTTLIISVS